MIFDIFCGSTSEYIHWCVGAVSGRQRAQTVDSQAGVICVRSERRLEAPQGDIILNDDAIVELIDDEVGGEGRRGHVLRVGGLLIQAGRKAIRNEIFE